MSSGILPPPNPAYTPGLQLLGVYSASAGASIDVVTRNQGGLTGPIFQSDFDEYEFEGVNLSQSTNATDMQIQFGTGAGPTWDTGNNYNWGTYGAGGNLGIAISDGNITGLPRLLKSMSNDSVYGNGSFSFKLTNPLGLGRRRKLHGTAVFANTAVPSEWFQVMGVAWLNVIDVMTGVRFAPSAGTITGTILVYGKAKSAIVASPIVISSVGAMVQIAQVIAAGSPATIDFSSIPATYNSLKILYNSQDTNGGVGASVIRVRFNNDTTAANYTATSRIGSQGGGAFAGAVASSALGVMIGFQTNSPNPTATGIGEITLVGYASSVLQKRVIGLTGVDYTGSDIIAYMSARWVGLTPINRITFGTDGTAFTNGSVFTLYGIL